MTQPANSNGTQDAATPLFTAIRAVHRRRRAITKAKRAADEIAYLNIVAMMDMMTIILVFLLKSVSFSAQNVSVSDAMTLPYSTEDEQPLEAVKIFVTREEVVVEDKKVAPILNGAIPQDFLSKENPYMVPNLKAALDQQAETLNRLAKLHPKLKAQDNLMILADKRTPYHVLMQVMYSASKASSSASGENKMAFRKYRLTVMKLEI